MMNDTYLHLLQNNEVYSSGDFTWAHNQKVCSVVSKYENAHSVVFVLQGELSMYFDDSRHDVVGGQYVILSQKELKEVTCSENAVILKYILTGRMAKLFLLCFQAFRMKCTTPIPVLPELSGWMEHLLLELSAGEPPAANRMAYFQDEFLRIAASYRSEYLAESYAAFYACSRKR